jgi:Ni,Fe-hydrogenase III large subunit
MHRLLPRFLTLTRLVLDRVDFRERVVKVGMLAREKTITSGVTGLIARAAGLPRDFRIQHPFPPYSFELLQRFEPALPLPALTGDTFSRFLIRVREVMVSISLIQHFVERWPGNTECKFITPLNFSDIPNFEFGIGCAEGWRGGVVYWVMKDRFARLYRCKVCDPSTLNWAGLKAAIEPQKIEGHWYETLLADFPLINKSFNLSYSGTDL